MKILIATGIYPPEIGGPAQYAYNLQQEFAKMGHEVRVAKFFDVRHLPSFIRHLTYFFKILPNLIWCDWCLALDTFSVALPTVAAGKLVRKKVVIRTGGDFLWENYVERTGDLVLLRNFYQTTRSKWNTKDRVIFRLTKWALTNASVVVFSTTWQRDIWDRPYQIPRASIIENFYGPKEQSYIPQEKNFLAGTRPLKWKNDARLLQSFQQDHIRNALISYDSGTVPFDAFMDKLSHCYAVVLASLGDVSPNMILDAIRHNKPFILTRETGLYDRLKDVGVFVDPENVDDIAEKILWLLNDDNYQPARVKIENFTFTHTWADIAREFSRI